MALKGIRVVELAGLAPAPFCGVILADFGASVTRVDRVNSLMEDSLSRGKQSIAIDLKKPEGLEVVRKMCSRADVLIEPFRKGVMERMGLGPDILMKENPRLIFARLTGYGQKGSLSLKAGHDINYIAISGMLSTMGRYHERPYPPLNLLADFAGGGLTCALGIAMALYERTFSGKGQVIDANMVQGSAYVGNWIRSARNRPFIWGQQRGTNTLDGGRAFYDTYETKDKKYMAVGALEPQFFRDLLIGLGIPQGDVHQTDDPAEMRRKFQDIFHQKTRDEWVQVFENLDACVTPILELNEAEKHEHNVESGTFVTNDTGVVEATPSPLLSRTPAVALTTHPPVGQNTLSVLSELGYSSSEVQNLLACQAVQQSESNSKAKL